jgi:hypothetical protein
MATTKELLLKYVNQDQHPRIAGRYFASEIYQILKGKLTPKNFFEQKEIDIVGARNIISGIAFEAQLKDIFEKTGIKFKYGDEIKREIKITDDIVLVVKPDFEFDDWVLETKYPTRTRQEIPEWYQTQLECEYRATNKPVRLGIFSYPFDITYINYQPDDKRWELIKQTLIEFDKKLKLWNQQQNQKTQI